MEGYGITRGRLSRYRLFWTKNIYDRQGAEQMFFPQSGRTVHTITGTAGNTEKSLRGQDSGRDTWKAAGI